jgi:hypothetical protein
MPITDFQCRLSPGSALAFWPMTGDAEREQGHDQ